MALPDFTDGNTLPASDLDDIIAHLQGTVGKTDAWHFRVSSGNNYLITLSDNAAARKFSIRDSDGVEVFSVDSDGTVSGASLMPTTLTLPAAAAPAQTTDAQIIWDSNDDVITVGNGAGTTRFGKLGSTNPGPSTTYTGGSSLEVPRLDHSHVTARYKSATQVFTTDTTFADVAAASGTFSFAIGASEVWEAEYWIPLAFGGSGGAKFQLTGPGTPTSVDITGTYTILTGAGTTDNIGIPAAKAFPAITAFSSAIGAADSASGLTNTNAGKYEIATASNFIHIRARIINGANAGTVMLQAAQNSSNSTTTLGIGSFMRAERIA